MERREGLRPANRMPCGIGRKDDEPCFACPGHCANRLLAQFNVAALLGDS